MLFHLSIIYIMATGEKENETLDSFTCPICLEIYSRPVTVPCGNNHTFCYDCIQVQTGSPEVTCTLCRQPFNPSQVIRNKRLESHLERSQIPCVGCRKNIFLSQMRGHQASCSKIDRSIRHFQPIRETAQKIPKDLPNRQTFHCPYCDKTNFDSTGLIEHCNKHHSRQQTAVVCPICASMPWGDKNQISNNFLQHLNMRHKFEYDTYVDYQQDDDEMLRAAIQASLQDS